MSASPTTVFAIVPAAGRSRRMAGSDKLLLPVGGGAMLLTFLATLRRCRLDGIVLVTRTETVRQLALAEEDHGGAAHRPPVLLAVNDDPSSEMIDSVRAGLARIGALDAARRPQGLLVCPADHAGLRTEDVDACLAAFRAGSDTIVVAARGGRRGHPLVFPAADADFVRSAACDGGLRALPRTHADRVRLVECSNESVLRDVDTPADYGRWSDPAGPDANPLA